MFEVCFDNSVKGALKYAQNPKYGKNNIVIGISFALHQGDIQEDVTAPYSKRKQDLEKVFAFNGQGSKRDTKADFEKYWGNCILDLEKLKSGADKIRIWSDNLPQSRCGLMFVADILKNSETEIYVVQLPEKLVRPDGVTVQYRGWGEVEPSLFDVLSSGQRLLSKDEINTLATKWQVLKSENAPLRAVKNGEVISADTDYYDDLIRSNFPQNSCSVADIIVHSIVKSGIHTGDVFIAERIQEFIKNGELAVVEDKNVGFYNTVVCVSK